MYDSDCACSDSGTKRIQVCLSHLLMATLIRARECSSVIKKIIKEKDLENQIFMQNFNVKTMQGAC